MSHTGLPVNADRSAFLALPRDTTPTLSVSSLSTFVYQIGGTVPPAQTITVTSDRDPVKLFASPYNYNWITVSPTNGATPAQISIGVSPTSLPADTYTGAVTIQAPDSTNQSLDIPVSLTVYPASAQMLAELVLKSFTAPATGVVGTAISGASTTVVNSGIGPATKFQIEYYLSQSPNVTIAGIDTGSGCAVSGLAAGGSFTCSANINIPSGITPGVYYLAAIADPLGQVVESTRVYNVLASSAGPITLAAAPALTAQLDVTSFLAPTSGVIGSAISGVSAVIVNNGTAAAAAFRVEYYLSHKSAVSTSDIDTNWGCDVPGLAVGASFQCGSSIGLPGTLSAGTYYLAAIADSGNVVPQPNRALDIRNSDNGPITLSAPITVSLAPNGIGDAFTGTQGIAPGAWVAIYGSNLSTVTQTWNPTPNQPLATSLGGVTVTINGIAAPISYVSPTQVNILVPSNVGEGSVPVVVTNLAGTAQANAVSTVYLPAVYCNVAAGSVPTRFYVTAVDPVTGEYVGNSGVDSRVARPVRPGETVDLYAVGLGAPIGSQFSTGTAFSAAYPLPLNFAVHLGGVATTPLYAALVGPGLYQVRFTVPAATASGDLPIYLDFGSAQSSQSVYLTVGQ